jgi:hypothetical protein
MVLAVASLFALGEVWPSLTYEAALLVLLTSSLIGVLVGGCLGKRLRRSRPRQG